MYNKENMNINWFSELPLKGKVDRNYKNMRTEFAWFVAQDANHTSLYDLPNLESDSVDIGIIIIPKNVEKFLYMDILKHLQRVCKIYGFMQEGPSWYFQSLPLGESFWFYDIMLNADFVLAHNDADKHYYEGLLNKPTYINPTLMIEDSIADLPTEKRDGVMLGGNLVRWYGGFNSLMVASIVDAKVYAPQMGRMLQEELSINEIEHLPYMEWKDWIYTLNKVKYAVHLNPNSIGGTFSLNCAYLGIPCIGNIDSNTQRLCFPDLSFRSDDLVNAKKAMSRLITDKGFYNHCSTSAKLLYKDHFSENVYLKTWQKIKEELTNLIPNFYRP